jgi:hypothetical protein
MCDVDLDQVMAALNAIDSGLGKIEVLSVLADLIDESPERGKLAIVILQVIHDYVGQLIHVSDVFAQGLPRYQSGHACP